MALTLTRQHNQSILIGKDIEIQVSIIDNKKVKLTVFAPDTVPIVRKELLVEAAQNLLSDRPSLRRLLKLG